MGARWFLGVFILGKAFGILGLDKIAEKRKPEFII